MIEHSVVWSFVSALRWGSFRNSHLKAIGLHQGQLQRPDHRTSTPTFRSISYDINPRVAPKRQTAPEVAHKTVVFILRQSCCENSEWPLWFYWKNSILLKQLDGEATSVVSHGWTLCQKVNSPGTQGGKSQMCNLMIAPVLFSMSLSHFLFLLTFLSEIT